MYFVCDSCACRSVGVQPLVSFGAAAQNWILFEYSHWGPKGIFCSGGLWMSFVCCEADPNKRGKLWILVQGNQHLCDWHWATNWQTGPKRVLLQYSQIWKDGLDESGMYFLFQHRAREREWRQGGEWRRNRNGSVRSEPISVWIRKDTGLASLPCLTYPIHWGPDWRGGGEIRKIMGGRLWVCMCGDC